MQPRLTRRRAFAVLAGLGAMAKGARAAAAPVFEWRGTALGADATLLFANADRSRAEQAMTSILAEIDRLESIFSLHLADSEISRLNRDAILRDPSLDMRALLDRCHTLHRATEGLFDPTVQIIWEYRRGEAERGNDRGGPVPARVLSNVGYHRLVVGPDRIEMPLGAAITLNGIAQGYITDRVAELLRHRGWSDVLIDLGETLALEGRSFDVEIRDSDRRIPLRNAALATSSAAPMPASQTAILPHIFHPRTGTAAARTGSTVTVRHPSATVADALSTALTLTDPGDATMARRILARFPHAKTWITRPQTGDVITED